MSTADWDKTEIKRLAHVSGRPLEVRCAEAFLKARWQVSLGTFYTDFASEKIRELDFLAERDFPFNAQNANRDLIEWSVRLRILGSCKGFPPEHSPATFSVSADSMIVKRPSFMCYECGIHGRNVAERMRRRSAELFLRHAGLSGAQQVVGFDILQRKEDQKKSQPVIEYSRKTDRDLYDGLDSAVKAAVYWYQEDRRQERRRTGGSNRGYIALNIPLLVSAIPFWNVSLDKGVAAEPEQRGSGFHISLYPSGDGEMPPEPIMSVLWAADEVDTLTGRLGQFIDWFVDEIELAVKAA